MPDTAAQTRFQIAMHFLHDGRVGLELKEGWYLTHDLQVATVDDTATTSAIVRGWASQPHESPIPRQDAYVQFPEHSQAFHVILTPLPNESLYRFTEAPDSLCRSFDVAFGSSAAEERAAAAGRFGDDLAREMRSFLARSRRKAAARLAGGAYLDVLHAHLAALRAVTAIEDQNFSQNLTAGVGAIMHDEQYLLLSDNAEVRGVYAQIQSEQSALYNWYMDLAQGGVARGR